MAAISLLPAVTRSRQIVAEKSSHPAVLRLLPELGPSKRVDHKYFVTFVSVVGALGLIMLLVINTLLAQDAFELRRLQMQVTALSDQREAVVKVIARASSPEELAVRAQVLGMIASENPRFLTLATLPNSYPRAKG